MRRYKTGIIVATLLITVLALSFFFFSKSSNSTSEAEIVIPHAKIEIESTDPFPAVNEEIVQADSDNTQQPNLSVEDPPSFSGSNSSANEHQNAPDEAPVTTQTKTRIVHHEAEYKTVHHEAKLINHDAEYKTIHHDEEGHYEETVISPAWDEIVEKASYEQHVFCNEASCHMDFTAAGLSSNQIWDHLEKHADKGEAFGHHTEDVSITHTEIIPHDAVSKMVWIIDREAYDERVLTKDAWDEVIPAYDERVLVKEAWDEVVSE